MPALLAYSIYTVFRSIWWGQKKFMLLGMTELIEQVSRVIIFLFLLALGFLFTDMAIAAALSFTLACFTSATVVLVLYFKKRKSKQDPLKNSHQPNDVIYGTENSDSVMSKKRRQDSPLKPLIKSSTPMTAVRVVTTIAFPIIAIILPMRLVAAGWSNSDALAHFGIALGMTLPLISIPQTLISSMATALVPELSATIQQDRKRAKNQILSCIKFTLFLNFLLFPIFVALGPSIGTFLFANEQAGIYLTQAAWIMIPTSLSLITNAILNALGHETRAMTHYFIGSVALFLCVWFLPQFIGIGALITGIGICMSIASILNLVKIGTLTGTDSKIAGLIIGFFIISVPAILIGMFLHGSIEPFLPLILSLPIAGTATFATLLALAYIFNLIELQDLRVKLQRKKAKVEKA